MLSGRRSALGDSGITGGGWQFARETSVRTVLPDFTVTRTMGDRNGPIVSL
jgi:hypothetical protein